MRSRNRQVQVHTLRQRGGAQKQDRGPHTGEQELQEERCGLEVEVEEERGEMQEESADLQTQASLGVWE